MILEHDWRTAASGGDALAVVATFEPELALPDIGLPTSAVTSCSARSGRGLDRALHASARSRDGQKRGRRPSRLASSTAW